MSPPRSPPGASLAGSESPAAGEAKGLSSGEVAARLQQYGPNAIPEQRPSRLRELAGKFTSPVPVMLEVTVALELVLGHHVQALLIGGLLLLNAVIASFQEASSNRALDELRKSLAITARARREGEWRAVAARELVPGDLVYLRAGDIVPADARLLVGALQIDLSALTGESAPVEAGQGASVLAGGIVRRGEASATVTATGARSASGRTAELVRTAQARGHLEETVLSVVKYLVIGDAMLALAVLLHALYIHQPIGAALPFALMLLIASVPAALPATFSLAMALGSRLLTRRGVLVTRLAAVQEFAAMDVLCTDKTGTITGSSLTLQSIVPVDSWTEDDALWFALLASDPATQDPIDLAIISGAAKRSMPKGDHARTAFTPFDSSTKRSEARFVRDGKAWIAAKGAPRIITTLTGTLLPEAEMRRLAAAGCRIVAVAAGPAEEPSRLVGLLGLRDPPRADSRSVLARLKELGIRAIMVTGDDILTGHAMAAEVGLGDRAAPGEAIRTASTSDLLACDVFAGVYPEDKLTLVERLQEAGHVVGMTGDGVNDAPALKRAEAGVAVSSAVDVAKAAASLVLTRPGLSGIVDAVIAGREIHQRMLTYTLNKLVKTFHLSMVLSIGVIGLGVFIVTPRQLLLLLFLNDFITMSLSSDRVRPSGEPEQWNIRQLTITAALVALCWTGFSLAVWWAAAERFGLGAGGQQSLMFLLLVLTSQGTIYVARTRGFLWQSRPGTWLLVSTGVAVSVALLLTLNGVLVPPIAASAAALLVLSVVVMTFLLDALKVAAGRLTQASRGRAVSSAGTPR